MFRACARSEPLHFAFDCERQHIFLPQREGAQNDYGQRNNRTDEERPHEHAALGEEADNSFKDVRHSEDNYPFGKFIKLISCSKPSGGNVVATSSGIGGNSISRIDCRQTFAKASLELFSRTFSDPGFTRPVRSTQNVTRTVPILTTSPLCAM